LHYIGLLFGIYVFLTIGIYHYLIVALEKRFGTWPWAAFLVIGLACIYLAVTSATEVGSMWWGYNSFVNLWSVKEMFDQHRRAQ